MKMLYYLEILRFIIGITTIITTTTTTTIMIMIIIIMFRRCIRVLVFSLTLATKLVKQQGNKWINYYKGVSNYRGTLLL
jgi:hypothetical protein